MGKKVWWVIIISLCVVVPLVGYYFYTAYQKDKAAIKKTYIFKTPPSYEVRANNFLAGQELLEARGFSVTSVTGVPYNMGKTDTMILDTARHTVGKEQSRRILEWVKKGGHLIVTPAAENVETDHLFEALGVFVGTTFTQDSLEMNLREKENSLTLNFTYLDRSYDGISSYEKDKTDPDIKSYSYRSVISEVQEDVVKSGAEEAPFHFDRPVGEGHLTVLGDARFMYNDQIGQADHALIFWHLVTQNIKNQDSRLWLIRKDEVQALYIWIWNKAKHLVLALFAVLLVWMWASSRRRGPVQKEEGSERRRLMEHIEASAAFYWKSAQGLVLLQSTRDALRQQISRRRPQWNHIEKIELYQNLADVAGLELPEVKTAMTISQYKEASQVKKCIIHLEQIRRKL